MLIQITSSSEDLWIETFSKPDLNSRFTQTIPANTLAEFQQKHRMCPLQYLEEINSRFIKQQQEELSSDFKTRLQTLKISPDDTKNSFETSELLRKSFKIQEDFIESWRESCFDQFRKFQALDLASITPEANSPQAHSPPSKNIFTLDDSEPKTQNELKAQFDSLDGIKPRARIFTWLSSTSPSGYYDKAAYFRALEFLKTNHQFLYKHQRFPDSARETIVDGSHIFFKEILDQGTIKTKEIEAASTTKTNLSSVTIGDNSFVRKHITNKKKGDSPFKKSKRPNTPHDEAALALWLDHPLILKPIAIERNNALWFPQLKNGCLEEQDWFRYESLSSRHLQVCIDVALALKCIHHKKIVHRDVKPANILITNDGRARLIDFGLSKSVKALKTKKPTLSGTISYIAPEMLTPRWSSKPINRSADIWSFGVILFEMATGEHPIPNEPYLYDDEVFKQIRSKLTNATWLLRRAEQLLKNRNGKIEKVTHANWDLVRIALLCIKAYPTKRLSIDMVLRKLTTLKKNHFGKK